MGKQPPRTQAWWLDPAFKHQGDPPTKREVYLVTFQRQRVNYTSSGHAVIDPSSLSREQVRDAVLEAAAHPEYDPVTRARRPGWVPEPTRVKRMAIFRELL